LIRENVYTGIRLEKPQGKRPLEKPRFRWEDNIIMEIQEVGLQIIYLIDLTQDRDTCESGIGH
jgi:hypothetical protein